MMFFPLKGDARRGMWVVKCKILYPNVPEKTQARCRHDLVYRFLGGPNHRQFADQGILICDGSVFADWGEFVCNPQDFIPLLFDIYPDFLAFR